MAISIVFFDRMATNDQEELEYLFAQTIFRCRLPLSLSELEYVKVDIKVEQVRCIEI